MGSELGPLVGNSIYTYTYVCVTCDIDAYKKQNYC